MRTHRIAAGGILFENKKVLLVRYRDAEIGSFLVCPGGGSTELELNLREFKILLNANFLKRQV